MTSNNTVYLTPPTKSIPPVTKPPRKTDMAFDNNTTINIYQHRTTGPVK